MDNRLLTQLEASDLILIVQPELRSNGSKYDLRLGQALMISLNQYGFSHLYHKITIEDDFFCEENDEVVLEKFYRLCVGG